jgi:putative ATPase
VIARAEHERAMGRRTVLFIDEIHRFNRAQQDALLPHVEAGVVTLVGATTENPSFAVNAAVLSRAQVVRLDPLRPKTSCGSCAAPSTTASGASAPWSSPPPTRPSTPSPAMGRRRRAAALTLLDHVAGSAPRWASSR